MTTFYMQPCMCTGSTYTIRCKMLADVEVFLALLLIPDHESIIPDNHSGNRFSSALSMHAL